MRLLWREIRLCLHSEFLKWSIQILPDDGDEVIEFSRVILPYSRWLADRTRVILPYSRWLADRTRLAVWNIVTVARGYREESRK